jgi:poly-beta-1,6 N-acetyl-D-glucosamine synthase
MWFGFLDQVEEASAPDLAACPSVSLILPAYNEGKVIAASIRSLLELDYPAYEILVVDDGSKDDTFLRAREVEGQHGSVSVRVITKRNGGKSSALNVGIAASRSEFVLCMDADSKLSPNTLRRAIAHMADPAVGAVAGNVKVINRRNILTNLQALEYVEGLNMARRAQAFFNTVNIIPGPMGLFRRRVVMEVGGYKHDTFAEDCDLTLSILERGWKIRYEPDAVAFTEAPEDLNSLIKQRYRWTRGILQALKKRRHQLFDTRNRGLTGALWYMSLEGFAWPVVNVVAQIYLVYIAAAFGFGAPLVLWWLQLTVLDLVGALYCVVAEEERLSLVPYAIIHRLSFVVMLDTFKVLATIEEFMAVEMSWGKLERQGRL